MDAVDIGWLAGIMDGEGTVTLMKRYGKNNTRFRQPTLSITSTDYEILARVQSLIAGTICNVSKYKERMKSAWIWSLNGSGRVFGVLQVIGPHLSCPKKKRRTAYLLDHYLRVTKRNGHYTLGERQAKIAFEDAFFKL
jgi:hypothetical protein